MSQYHFFDDKDYLILPTFVRGVSEDNFLTGFFCPKQQHIQRTITQEKSQQMSLQAVSIPQFDKYKSNKAEKKKSVSKQKKDYKKNICGYITKKIVREFMAPVYKEKVQELCQKHECNYQECRDYYDKKIERITGPTHLDMLLNTSKQASNMKKCFKQFFIWFLRHRYLRYLIVEGKMQRKDIYIDYKNKTLLYLGSMQQEQYQDIHSLQSESKETIQLFQN